MAKLPRVMTRLLKLIALAAAAMALALAVFVGYLVIVHNTPLELPAPTGRHPVGRVEYDWVDSARMDPLADQSGVPRELVVWAWYPSAKAGPAPAPYLPTAWAQARDRDQGIGVLAERNFSQIQTHSFEGVAPAEAPETFPVLVMEPGMGPMATDYTALAENLASRGYIVLGIQPTYTSNWTVFPDGRVAYRSAKGTIPDSDSPAQADADGSRILAVWSRDVEFVLDQIAKINADQASPFYKRMDLEHIGIWGHSFGGATALLVCQNDPRCKAGVDMDGTPFGEERQASVPRPFMFLTEDYRAGCDQNCTLMRQAYLKAQPGAAYSLSVAGAGHFNFSDLPFRQTPVMRPLFALAGFDGSIPPERGLQIANAYLAAFFDQTLKGSQENLLQGPSPDYPEVTFEKR